MYSPPPICRYKRGGGGPNYDRMTMGRGRGVWIPPKMMTSFMNSPLYCFHCSHCSYCYTVGTVYFVWDGTTNKKAQKYTQLISVITAPTPVVYFFNSVYNFDLFWPLMANDGDFVTNLCTFWCKCCAGVPKMTNISFDKQKDKTENQDITSYLVI